MQACAKKPAVEQTPAGQTNSALYTRDSNEMGLLFKGAKAKVFI